MKVINSKVKFTYFERLNNKLQKSNIYNNKISTKTRRKKLNNTDFTIISNNCWGGVCYEYFGMKKLSPTVGLYFYSEEYIKFVTNLKKYLNEDLKFIDPKESKYFEKLKEKNQLDIPIGLLGDVEIVFLHYSSREQAYEKWNRRIDRINWDNLIIKYSNMNLSNSEHIRIFNDIHIPHSKKILFLNSKTNKYKNSVYYPGFDAADELLNDTNEWNKYINVYELINRKSSI